jgi:hypothetical protein
MEEERPRFNPRWREPGDELYIRPSKGSAVLMGEQVIRNIISLEDEFTDCSCIEASEWDLSRLTCTNSGARWIPPEKP